MFICGEISWWVVWYCLCSNGKYLREQKCEQGAKRTVVVMLQVSTMSREFIIEWVINGATESLSLLRWSGSVVKDSYQWLSSMYACHSMLTFTTSHRHKLCKSTETTRMARLLVQQPKILAESRCKSIVLVENEWQ